MGFEAAGPGLHPARWRAPMTGLIITEWVALMVAATAVALLARRLHLPYTVGLVLAGIALALSPLRAHPGLTHDLIFVVILPPLLFEAAITLNWPELKRDALPIAVLSVAGTLISAAVVGGGLIVGLHWPLLPALLFGSLIAATDPVAVIAMFKDNGVGGRLRLLVESESLFNDGVAAVLFGLLLPAAQQGGLHLSPASLGGTLLLSAGGGVLIGMTFAAVAIAVAGGTDDHLLEGTLTTIVAYGAFLSADRIGASGVLAVVAAGLLMGSAAIQRRGEDDRWITRRGRVFVRELWEFIAFVANSVVFLLIGLTLGDISFDRLGSFAMAAIILLVLLSRAVTVYPLCAAFRTTRWAVPAAMQHVLFWGGLRGALGLALALSLPPALPYRTEIVLGTFGVVAFSVVLQGISMPVLMQRLGFVR